MPVKKVLMTGDTVGGVWTFTLDLARELCARGIDVCLAAFGGAASHERNRQAQAIKGLSLLASDLKLEWMEDPWIDIEQSASILSRLEREFAPDVVHLNSYGHGRCARQAPVILTAHSCVASWWQAVRHEELPESWNQYRRHVEESIQTAEVVITPSIAMGDSLGQHYRTRPRRSLVIPNGRPADRPGMRAKQPFIFSAGRLWDEAKNVAALARVADRLSWPVYLAGATCDSNGNETAFEGCRTVGVLSPAIINDWLTRAAIYAAPAKYEPFGLAILEAASAGCALVLGDIPSLREIWGDAALFASDGQLERTLQQLIASESLRNEYGLRAQARARAFTAKRMADGYLDVYESVARRRYACAS